MGERLLAGALLAVAAAALVWFVKGDVRAWRLFQRLSATGDRQDRYRRWCVKQWLAFAAPALVGLTLLGRLDALVVTPAGFAPVAAAMPIFQGDALGPLAAGGAVGIVLGGAAAWAVLWRRRRRGIVDGRPPLTLGDISALVPRNRAELGWAALLSVSAGVTEELAFRLFLPLLLLLVTGDPFTAFAVAGVAFGAMHLYQGWIGVVATTLIGGLLTAVYLASGSLWAAMAFHAVIDLNGMVVRPLLAGVWRKR